MPPLSRSKHCLAIYLLASLGTMLAAAPAASAAERAADRVSANRQVRSAPETAAVAALRRDLAALSPSVDAKEAARLAIEAHLAARQLARDYRVVRSPHFHNFLVNARIKPRGLCHHWARDLGNRLAALNLRTLNLRWGIARAGTLREHNCVVVTARGQPFERGIVLDAWRHSGRLYAGAVATDKYPWKEDPNDSFKRRLSVLPAEARPSAGSGTRRPRRGS